MKKVKLGNSELMVSCVCMGCMGFGDPTKGQHSWTLNEEQSRAIIQQGYHAGINFFDTAIAYQSGTSEQFLGKALHEIARREDVVIATKFLPRTAEEIERGISGQQHIEVMLNKSLENLKMDYVDLYIAHMWDYKTPLYEIMDGLNRMVQAGKVRYIGISNCQAWQLAEANCLAEKEGFAKFISLQGHYNLIFREEEREMIPYCEHHNIAITPYSPLAGGRLTRTNNTVTQRLEEDSFARQKYDATKEQDQQIIQRVHEIAQHNGVSMTEIALAWLMHKKAVPVVGMTKPHHIEGAIHAMKVELTKQECQYLEELYVPHKLVGVMAQNTAETVNQKKVWSTGEQKIDTLN